MPRYSLTIIFVLLFSCAVGCGGGRVSTGLCTTEMTCGGHGQCAEVASIAQCVCDPGYTAVTTDKGPDCAEVVGPCEGIDCGEHGTCEAMADYPAGVCVCEAQWHNVENICAEGVPDSTCDNHGVYMIIDAQLKVLNSGIDSPPRRVRPPGSTQRTRLIKNVASIRICQ